MSEQKPKINSLEIISHGDIIPTKLTFSERFNVILGNGEAEEFRFINLVSSMGYAFFKKEVDLDDGSRDFHYPEVFGYELVLNATGWQRGDNLRTHIGLGHGLYHEEIRRIMRDELDDVQSFNYTQNATVLDHLYFESAEDVQRSLILAEAIEQEDGPMRPYWRDPTEEEAEGFLKAYGVGILHVSQLLRLRGMW